MFLLQGQPWHLTDYCLSQGICLSSKVLLLGKSFHGISRTLWAPFGSLEWETVKADYKLAHLLFVSSALQGNGIDSASLVFRRTVLWCLIYLCAKVNRLCNTQATDFKWRGAKALSNFQLYCRPKPTVDIFSMVSKCLWDPDQLAKLKYLFRTTGMRILLIAEPL